MKLKIQRSQRTTGVVSKSILFCVDARVELTPQQQADVVKYKLGSQVIYNSEASKKHLANADARGGLKGLASLAMAAMNLNITIDGLQRGQHIECKDLNEVCAAEEALKEACGNLKTNLDIAATFDGREIVFNFDNPIPEAVAA
jgi:hypothetical protein